MTDLADELRELGRTIVIEAPPDDLAERVLARLAQRQPRQSPASAVWQWLTRSRRRLVAVVIAAVILALALTPPVRAAVAHWLHIGGVLIKSAPPAGPSPTPEPVPTTGQSITLDQARRLVRFSVGVPAALGDPDRVSVSDDHRVVSMDWGTGSERIHLDQFDGTLSWVFVKRGGQDIEQADVDGRDGVWFPNAHEIVYVDRDGRERTEQARIAGPCLVWERVAGGPAVTLRLEGNLDKLRALTIAESVG